MSRKTITKGTVFTGKDGTQYEAMSDYILKEPDTMAIKAADVKKKLPEPISKGMSVAESKDLTKKERAQQEANRSKEKESFYKALTELGETLVKDFFDGSTELTAKKPDNQLPANPWLEKWKEFDKRIANEFADKTDDKGKVIEEGRAPDIKTAIDLGSQELWLDTVKDELPNEGKDLTYEMKSKLIKLKNDEDKLSIVVAFLNPKKTKGKTPKALAAIVNRKAKETPYVRSLLAKIEKLEALLKQQPSSKQPKTKKAAAKTPEYELPTKPSIATIVRGVEHGLFVQMLNRDNYFNYISDPKIAGKIKSNDRSVILEEVAKWVGVAEDKFPKRVAALKAVLEAT